MSNLTPEQEAAFANRYVTQEYRRRVERAQKLAHRIADYAGYLVRDLDDRAPDDMSQPLTVRSFEKEIGEMAAEVRRLFAEADAIRDIAAVTLPLD